MKYRNGFVSNSSSSSFVLSYSKANILTDPKEILKYLKEDGKSIIFKGWDLGEGDDIFELDEEQKSLIRKFPEEFVKTNSGTVTRENYVYDKEADEYHLEGEIESSKLTAYIGNIYFRDVSGSIDYYTPSVDMSDVPKVDLSVDEILAKDKDVTLSEKCKISDNYYRIKEEREKAARASERDKVLVEGRSSFMKRNPNINPEEVISEIVQVSTRSCDPDGCEGIEEFAERYLSSECFEDIDSFSFRKYKKQEIKPFAILYRRVLRDKADIVEYLRIHERFNPSYICWCNEVYNTVEEVENIDFFEVGEEERDLILKNSEKFIQNPKEVRFFIDAAIAIGGASISVPPTDKLDVTTGYGKIARILKGTDLIDFKRNFLE